jgi:hypothetical protein
MKSKAVWPVFWVLVVAFVAMVVLMFVDRLMTGPVMFPVWAVIFCLGAALIVLTALAQPAGKQKAFLLLSGSSAAGLPFFSVLHNFTYALINMEEPVFFILSVIVCPLAFLVGVIGSLVISARGRSPQYSGQNI